MKPYIDECVEGRKAATTPAEEKQWKDALVAPFGKLAQKSDNYSVFTIVKNEDAYDRIIKRTHLFQRATIIGDENDGDKDENGFVDVSDRPLLMQCKNNNVLEKKPLLAAAAILSLGRVAHARHWYFNVKRLNPSARLLYAHTDSWIYTVVGPLVRNNDAYDFSNYPRDHAGFDDSKRKIPGYVKDETKARLIKEVVVLGRNQYSILMADDATKVALAGVSASAAVNHEHLYAALFESKTIDVSWDSIVKADHRARVERIVRTVLTGTDASRFVLDGGIETVPYGHYRAQ